MMDSSCAQELDIPPNTVASVAAKARVIVLYLVRYDMGGIIAAVTVGSVPLTRCCPGRVADFPRPDHSFITHTVTTVSNAETELKLTLSAKAMRSLLMHPLLGKDTATRLRLRNIYYDTPDLSLMAARIAVRERFVGRRCLLTVKTAGTSQGGLSRRGEWEGPARSGQFDFDDLVSDTELAHRLSALAWQLIPVFETNFVRHVWTVHFDNSVIEVALDDGEVVTGGPGRSGKSRVLRESIRELELELKSGSSEALFRFALALTDADIPLWPEDRSKAERGLALYTGKAAQPGKTALTPPRGDTDSQHAFCQLALQEVAQLGANGQGLRATAALIHNVKANSPAGPLPDPEYIHQIRVSIRRLRTALSVFGDALPKPARDAAAKWRQAWGDAASFLGQAREWDVLHGEWMPLWRDHEALQALVHSDLATLEAWIHHRRMSATNDAIRFLDTPAYAQLVLGFLLWLHGLQASKSTRQRPLSAWASKRVARQQRRLVRLVRKDLGGKVPELHVWRLQIKKVRYAVEQLRAALPKRQRRWLPLLAKAQTHLGMLNDLGVAQSMLASAPSPGREALKAAMADHEREGMGGVPQMTKALRQMTPS